VDPDILAQADGPGLVDLARESGSIAASREVLARAIRLVEGEPLRAARYALAAAFIGGDVGPPDAAARRLEERLRAACGDLGEALFEVHSIVDADAREEPLAIVLERLAIGDPPEATRQLAKLRDPVHRDRVLAALVEATRGVFLAQKIADEAVRAGALARIGEWEEAELVVADIASARGRAAAHQRIGAAARASGEDARARKHEALADEARSAIADDVELAAAMREAASIVGGDVADALLTRGATLDPSPSAARDARLRRSKLAVAAGALDRAVDVETIVVVFPELARATSLREASALEVAGDAIAWAEARSAAVVAAAAEARARPSRDELDGSWDGEAGPSTVRHDLDRGKPPWAGDAPPIQPAAIVAVAPVPPEPTTPPAPVADDDDVDATSIMGSAERRALQLATRAGDAAIVRDVAERIANERDLEERRLAVLTEGYDTARRIPIATDLDPHPSAPPAARVSDPPAGLPSVIGPPMEVEPPPSPRRAPVVAAQSAPPKRSALAVVGIVALVAAAAIVVLFYARMLSGHR
jgi:hypothetical protein